jgi:SAM-dependent methyltransferase
MYVAEPRMFLAIAESRHQDDSPRAPGWRRAHPSRREHRARAVSHHERVTSPDPLAETRRLAAQASEQDPTGWFEQVYLSARSGTAAIPWDRGGPHPLLAEWTAEHALDGHGRSAVVVGCGLGSDAEHLATLGFATTAFDVAPSAVASARERHPGSRVQYTTANLLDLPAEWRGGFDFVLESLTVQSLPVSLHPRATEGVRSVVAPGGTLLVIAGARTVDSQVAGPPWLLTRTEVEAFSGRELHIQQIEELIDHDDPEVRRWRVELRRTD